MIGLENIEEDRNIKRQLSKTQLVKILFDKQNPEMITYLNPDEVDKFAILSILINEENKIRNAYGFPENPFSKIINKNLVLRTSIKGKRAEQGVEIITMALNEEEQVENNNQISGSLKKVLGR